MSSIAARKLGDFLRKHETLTVLLAIAAAFAIAHGPRIVTNLRSVHPEDLSFFQHNARAVESLRECFNQGSFWPGIYRPLTTNLYYFIGRELFANRLEVYHLINVASYIANGLLLYLVCLGLLPRMWATLAAIVFVSRLSHAAVVTNTCEFQGLLSTFFCLLALKSFMASRMRREFLFGGLTAVAFGLALFSKETAFVFPAVLLIYAWLFDGKLSWRRYLAPLLACILMIVLYALALRATVPYKLAGVTIDASFSNIARNYSAYFLAFANLLTIKAQDIFMPREIVQLASARWFEAALVLFLGVSVGLAAIQRRLKGAPMGPGRTFVFGLLFFVIALAPYAVLQSRLFPRYGYFADAGLSISSAAVLQKVASVLIRKRPLAVGSVSG